MADIRLDFGVDKGVSKINIEKDLTDIVNQLPTFGIKVGVNAESLQEFKAQLESTKEQINGLKDFQLNLGGANVAIQTAGELDKAIKDISVNLANISNFKWTKWDDTQETITFGTALERIHNLLERIKGTTTGLAMTLDKAFRTDPADYTSVMNLGKAFGELNSEISIIKKSLGDFEVKGTVIESFSELNKYIREIHWSLSDLDKESENGLKIISLTSYFDDIKNAAKDLNTSLTSLKSKLLEVFKDPEYENLSIKLGEEFQNIKNTIASNKTEVYTTSSSYFDYDSGEQLANISKNITTLTEQLSKVPEILTQISTLIDTISKKEFSITNTFTGNLENFKDKAQETRLYRDRLLELYKVVRDYNSEAERMASTRYVNGEVNRLFQQIPGTGISNVFEMLNQLEELGVSERSIYSMSNMKSIEAKMSRLNELKSIYETLFQEVQKYQQAESKSALAKTGFEIKMPDTSGFQKANEALDKYLNKITEIKTAAADAAMQQVSSKQTTERLETAKQMAAIVEQSLATPQQQLSELQAKITETFDLSKITPNTEKITQTLSGVKQQLTEIQAQIRSTFDLSAIPFDTTKITSGVAGIKNQLSEIQVQVNGIFDPSKMIFDPKSIEQIAAATKNAFDLSGANLDSSKFTRFTAEITQQLTRIQNQLRTTFNTANLVIDTAKVDDFLRHVSGELVRIQNQLRETFNGARLVVDTAKVGDFTTEVKRQIAEVKAEIATIFDLSGVTFDYTQFDAFTGRIKSGFDEIRTSVKSSLDGIKAYINEVTGAYANLLVQIDKAANNPVVQKVAETTTSTATSQPGSTEANQQAAISVRELATAHKELAQAMAGSTAANKASRTSAEQQAMSMKTKLSIAQALFMTERQLSQLLTANAHDESAEYLQLADAFDILSMAADRVRENVHDVEYIFKEQFGKTADYLTRVRTEMLAYQAQVEKLGTGGHITDSQFYGAISSMKNIQALYPDKAGLAIYDQIIERLRLFMEAEADVKSGLTSIDEALNYVGLEGKTVIQDTVDMMKEFNAQVTGETPVLKLHEQITSLSGAIKTARESGKDVLNTEQFKNVNIVMDQLKNALNQVETENKSVNQAFADLGTTAKQSFDKAKIAISDLKTLLNETAKPTKEGAVKIFDASALEKSIDKMQGLANQALREPNAKKTKEYLDLANHLNLANQAFEALKQNELTAEQALAQYGTNGTEYVRDLTAVVDAFNIVLKKTANETIKSNNAAKAQAQAAKEAEAEQKKLNQTQAEALANAKRLKEAYLQVLRMQSSMVTSLNSAGNKNSALTGSNEYQAVQNYLNQFKSATAAMASENLNIFDAFTSIGGNFENAVLRANEAMAQLKIVTGETAKETKDAEAKVTSLAKAYDALARANRLINNNQNLKNTAEYTSLVRNRDEMQHMVDLLEKGVKTVGGYRQQYTSLDDVFQQLNVDGEQLFENLRVSASRFNNEIAKTEKSITLDAAYKKLGSLQNLLNGKKGKTLVGTDEYNAVLDSINQLATAIAKAESQQISMNQAFEQMGVTSKDALGQMNLAAEKMKILLDSTQVTDMKTAWQEVQSATRLLNNNQSMAGDTTYQKLKSDVELMAKAIEEARKNNTTLDVQLQQLGKDGKQALDNIRLGALDLKAAMDGVGVSGTTTEVKLEQAMNSLKRLQADADKYQGYSFNLNGSPAVIEQTEQYTKLQAQIQTVARALELMRNSGLSADEALAQLGTTGTELFGNIELNSVRMKGAIDQVTRAYKEATSGAKASNQEEKNRQNLIAKAYSLMSKSQKITTNWTMAASGKSASSYRDIQGYANALGNLISQFKAGSISSADFSRQISTIDAGLKQGITTIQAAGENAASLSLRLNNIAQRFGAWFGATRIIMRVITSLKQMISTSIELDDAFTQLQIVTKNTDATYERFGTTVARIAKETAVSMKDITDAATTFARLGYNLDEAAKLAEYTAKLQNVGDIETQEAQDAITSILKAYDEVDADHIEEVMNKLVTTGNAFPISVSQIAEGMTNASSALAAAGNTFDQSVALLTAANTTLQDAAKSSTALRTITARLRRTDSELDELGESMESSKYDKLIKSLTDLDIALVDANNEYRSTYDIMSDIAGKWDEMTTMEQAALAETIAGTRQQAAFYSIISNFQEASGAMDAMANSAGELEKAYDVYLGSTTAHINQFKAAFEELGANTFNSKMLSNVVDLGTAFTGFANALVKANMLLPTIFAGATIPRIARFILASKTARNEVTTLTQTLLKQKAVNDELTISLAALNKQQLQNIQVSLEQALQTKALTQAEYTNINATIEQMAVNAELAGSNRTLAASFKAITTSIPGWGWVMLSIMAVIGVVGKLTQIAQESKQAFIDSSDAIGNEINTLKNYKTSIEEIANSTETETEKLQKLNEIRETLNNTYDANIERASSEKDTIASLNKEIDDQIAYRRKLYLIENENKYKNAVRESRDFQSSDFHWGSGYTDYKLPVGNNKGIQSRLSESISSLFTTDSAGRMTIGANAKNEIELLKEYESVMMRISKIRSDRMKLGQDLNSAELAVFNNLKKNYEELKNDMSESGYSYDSIMEYAQQKAEDIIAATEQGSMSIEEWREELIRLADGDEYVIEKLRELVDGMIRANDAVEETVDVLAEAYKEMERIQSMLDSLDESMQTAKDIFEDLAKTIKSNNDADKFFTSTEIIDLLDKYPELSNAILETSYGYKIETEALEQLRQTKLAEQKDALAAQIAETESAIESVKKRIDAYTAEVKGVKSLAEAKVELAKIDAAVAKLNSINSATPFATGLENTQKSLEARRKALAGWVGTAEELDKLNESLKKSKMQYTVLGKVFDDVEDKSKDVSKALSDQKNKLKDLADEYKDAQDKINDLVKLTMDMIKKELNLEKDSIKERIDNFKKLIDKKKELLDIEKDYTVRYCPLYLERIQCIPLNCWDSPRGLYATA